MPRVQQPLQLVVVAVVAVVAVVGALHVVPPAQQAQPRAGGVVQLAPAVAVALRGVPVLVVVGHEVHWGREHASTVWQDVRAILGVGSRSM